MPAPFQQCAAQHEGRAFSPLETSRRREFPQPAPPKGMSGAELAEYHKSRDWSRDCCYLDECGRRSYSY